MPKAFLVRQYRFCSYSTHDEDEDSPFEVINYIHNRYVSQEKSNYAYERIHRYSSYGTYLLGYLPILIYIINFLYRYLIFLLSLLYYCTYLYFNSIFIIIII